MVIANGDEIVLVNASAGNLRWMKGFETRPSLTGNASGHAVHAAVQPSSGGVSQRRTSVPWS
jgi:hypothetical protein